MADYISKYTGAQIDLAIASGSTPSGLITASKLVLGGASGSVDGITVKGDISASGNFYLNGNIEATQITSSQVTSSVIITEGSNTFGDAATDQHTFNGSISASKNLRVTGDISSSGNTVLGNATTDQHTFNGSISASKNLRVTGNISGSATSTGSFAKVHVGIAGGTGVIPFGGVPELTVAGDISSSGYLFVGGKGPLSSPSRTNYKTISGSNGVLRVTDGTFFGNYPSNTHIFTGSLSIHQTGSLNGLYITGSALRIEGNISSSGDLTVDGDISASGDLFIRDSVILASDWGEYVAIGRDTIESDAQLTVEGNISMSGELFIEDDEKIYFGRTLDTSTYIERKSDNLEIAADDDLILKPDDDLVMQVGTTTKHTFFGEGRVRLNSTSTTAPTSAELEVVGDISSSGQLNVGNRGSTNGHITASGNISASNTSFFSGQDGIFTRELRVGGASTVNKTGVVVSGQISASGTFDLRESASIGLTTTGVGNGTTIPNKGLYVSGSISGSETSTGSFGRVETGKIDIDSITGNWTNAGNTVADLGTITTVDIDGGTINGITDLAVADGGTGVSSLTDGGVLLGSGTSGITAMAVLTDGQMIVGDGSTDPVAESGATLRTSIGVGTGDDVKFSKAGIGRTTTDEHAKLTVEGNISASKDFLLKEGQFIIWDSGSKGADTHTRDESFIRAINNRIYFGSGSAENLDYHLTVSMSNGGTSVGVGAPIPPFNYRGLTVEGEISSSGQFMTMGSASIGVTTTGVGNGTTIPNKGIYVSGSISGSATSTGSFGYVKTDGDVIADGGISGSEINIAAAQPVINITETDESNHTWAIIGVSEDLWIRNQSDTNLPVVITKDAPNYTLTVTGSSAIKQPQVGIGNTKPPEALTVSGSISSSGATYLDKSTFANDDATPTVLDGTYWETGTNTDTITTFDNGKIGQIIYVISRAAITYDVTSTTLKCGTTDLVTAAGDLTTWLYDGTNWTCLGFTDQSDDLS